MTANINLTLWFPFGSTDPPIRRAAPPPDRRSLNVWTKPSYAGLWTVRSDSTGLTVNWQTIAQLIFSRLAPRNPVAGRAVGQTPTVTFRFRIGRARRSLATPSRSGSWRSAPSQRRQCQLVWSPLPCPRQATWPTRTWLRPSGCPLGSRGRVRDPPFRCGSHQIADRGHEFRLSNVALFVEGWRREFGNVSEEDCGRSCDGWRTGVQRRWPGCRHRERGTTCACRRGDSVAARSRPWGRWGLLGPWRRSRLGRPWRLGLRWGLGLRARMGLCHRSVWARHLVPLVADPRSCCICRDVNLGPESNCVNRVARVVVDPAQDLDMGSVG
jgi:hypothetical protein